MGFEIDLRDFYEGPPGWNDSQHVAPRNLLAFFQWLRERVRWLRAGFEYSGDTGFQDGYPNKPIGTSEPEPMHEHVFHVARLWGHPVPDFEEENPPTETGLGEDADAQCWFAQVRAHRWGWCCGFAQDNRLRIAQHVIDNAIAWLDANGHPGVLPNPEPTDFSNANRELSRLLAYVKAQAEEAGAQPQPDAPAAGAIPEPLRTRAEETLLDAATNWAVPGVVPLIERLRAALGSGDESELLAAHIALAGAIRLPDAERWESTTGGALPVNAIELLAAWVAAGRAPGDLSDDWAPATVAELVLAARCERQAAGDGQGVAAADMGTTGAPAKMRRCDRLAYLAFEYAERKAGQTLTTRKAWDYLREHGIEPDAAHGDPPELKDHNLPAFESFERYLRKAREVKGEQRNTPRAGRRAGGSIVRQKDI